MKKIYFSGSIRGGRTDQSLYAELIDHMKKNHIVLTEHIGYQNAASPMSDEDIYTRDINWLKQCDLVIAECTTPSLGVGYELAYGEQLKKPVYILCREDANLSAMLQGNPYFHLFFYERVEQIYTYLDEILEPVK